MNQSPTTPLNTVMVNEDPIKQAHPDHGVPSEGAAPADTVSLHTGESGGRSTTQLDDLGKDFGTFYPRGHMVVAFQAQADLERLAQGLKDLGQVATDHLEVTSHQMIEFAERNIQEAGVLATLGTSVTMLKGFLDAARKDGVFLIISTPDDETAEQVTTVLHEVPHLLAERYHILAIETVV
ncbi:MAG: hypothetical protein ABI135_09530 [Rhodoferax sp.]